MRRMVFDDSAFLRSGFWLLTPWLLGSTVVEYCSDRGESLETEARGWWRDCLPVFCLLASDSCPHSRRYLLGFSGLVRYLFWRADCWMRSLTCYLSVFRCSGVLLGEMNLIYHIHAWALKKGIMSRENYSMGF